MADDVKPFLLLAQLQQQVADLESGLSAVENQLPPAATPRSSSLRRYLTPAAAVIGMCTISFMLGRLTRSRHHI
jgi:hypothetical protein